MGLTIQYLGYYDTDDNADQQRNYVRSATTKMDYIAGKLEELGIEVHIVSMAGTKLKRGVPRKTFKASPRRTITLFPSLGYGGSLKRRFARYFMERHMRKYLDGLGPSDIVLAYHSLGYADLIKAEKQKRNFKLILEVEEFYSDVTGREKDAQTESEIFAVSDAYLCSSELLAERFGQSGRSCIVCSGIYQMAPIVAPKHDDGKTHVVYAGTLDSRKGGAAAAAAAGALLDASFHVHILGFGREDEVQAIESAVTRANEHSMGAKITYDGYKSGVEFTSFIQSCDIGLCPQDPDAKFNTTSFPSKVFMYLSNGLPVVSVDLPVFRRDDLRDVLFLSDGNKPEALAQTIRTASESKATDPSMVMKSLDEEFGSDLNELIKEVSNADR